MFGWSAARHSEHEAMIAQRRAKEYHEAKKLQKQERTGMDNYILTYDADIEVHGKIKAIKAVRTILGVTLKDGKDIIEGNGRFEDGIIVTKLQAFAINGVYLEAFVLSCGMEGERSGGFRVHDFQFERIPEVTYREDYTSVIPSGAL